MHSPAASATGRSDSAFSRDLPDSGRPEKRHFACQRLATPSRGGRARKSFFTRPRKAALCTARARERWIDRSHLHSAPTTGDPSGHLTPPFPERPCRPLPPQSTPPCWRPTCAAATAAAAATSSRPWTSSSPRIYTELFLSPSDSPKCLQDLSDFGAIQTVHSSAKESCNYFQSVI